MNYDPIKAWCRQRISDLGGAVIAGTNASLATATRSGLAESDKRAVIELQLIITMCEGLNKMQEMIEPK